MWMKVWSRCTDIWTLLAYIAMRLFRLVTITDILNGVVRMFPAGLCTFRCWYSAMDFMQKSHTPRLQTFLVSDSPVLLPCFRTLRGNRTIIIESTWNSLWYIWLPHQGMLMKAFLRTLAFVLWDCRTYKALSTDYTDKSFMSHRAEIADLCAWCGNQIHPMTNLMQSLTFYYAVQAPLRPCTAQIAVALMLG